MIPLPWERLLWSGRSARPGLRARYFLTDFRVVCLTRGEVREIGLHDITAVERTESGLERLIGASTITIASNHSGTIVLRSVRRGAQLAALLELFSGEPLSTANADAVRAALDWNPRHLSGHAGRRETLVGAALVLVAIIGAVIGLHGKTTVVAYAPDDPLYPSGHKRPRAEIVRFMEQRVMPWAREALGPIKGGPDHVTCETCHGADAAARDWAMPAVAALPQPDLRQQGWEIYGGALDAQMRNAIYGYLAQPEKQSRATYMREVVLPGMARLLQRPAYDFTQPYEYNRSRRALGCYHCHKVK